MNGRSHRCNGSLSRGFAPTRVVIAAILVVVIFLVVRRLFPTREERLRAFIDDSRDAVVELREEDFFARLDPAIRYQTSGGMAELRRDWARYKASGIGRATIVGHEETLDSEGADVKLDVVLTAGLRPLGQVSVSLRVLERDGVWTAAGLSWR